MPRETTSIKLREFLLKVFLTSLHALNEARYLATNIFLVLRYQDSSYLSVKLLKNV